MTMKKMGKTEEIMTPDYDAPPQTFMGKVKKAYSLMTIEPALLVHMTASFLGNIMITDLLYYQTCTVNLGKSHEYCER